MTHNIQQLWNARYKSLIKYSFPGTDKCPIFGQNRDFIAIVHFTGHRWCIHKRPWIGLKSDLEIINLIGGIIRLYRLIAFYAGYKSDLIVNKICSYQLGIQQLANMILEIILINGFSVRSWIHDNVQTICR